MTDASANRRLGDFIRAHRERQPPPTNAASRRRTPGLRREELADAAGISATWNNRTTFRLGYAGEFGSDRHVHAAALTVGRRF